MKARGLTYMQMKYYQCHNQIGFGSIIIYGNGDIWIEELNRRIPHAMQQLADDKFNFDKLIGINTNNVITVLVGADEFMLPEDNTSDCMKLSVDTDSIEVYELFGNYNLINDSGDCSYLTDVFHAKGSITYHRDGRRYLNLSMIDGYVIIQFKHVWKCSSEFERLLKFIGKFFDGELWDDSCNIEMRYLIGDKDFETRHYEPILSGVDCATVKLAYLDYDKVLESTGYLLDDVPTGDYVRAFYNNDAPFTVYHEKRPVCAGYATLNDALKNYENRYNALDMIYWMCIEQEWYEEISIGDVVEFAGRYWRCEMIGWKDITYEWKSDMGLEDEHDLANKIFNILTEEGQHNPNFPLGSTIRNTPLEVRDIIQKHINELI